MKHINIISKKKLNKVFIYFGCVDWESPKRMRHQISYMLAKKNDFYYLNPINGNIFKRIKKSLSEIYFLLKIKNYSSVYIISSRISAFIFFIISKILLGQKVKKFLFICFDSRAIQSKNKILNYLFELDTKYSLKLCTKSFSPSSYLLRDSKNREIIYPWVGGNFNQSKPSEKNIEKRNILLFWAPFTNIWDFKKTKEIILNHKLRKKFKFLLRGSLNIEKKEIDEIKSFLNNNNIDYIFKNFYEKDIPWKYVFAGFSLIKKEVRHNYTVEVPNKTRHYSASFTPLLCNGMKNINEIGPLIKINKKVIADLSKKEFYKKYSILEKCNTYNHSYNEEKVSKLFF